MVFRCCWSYRLQVGTPAQETCYLTRLQVWWAGTWIGRSLECLDSTGKPQPTKFAAPTNSPPQPRFTSTELQFQTCCTHTPRNPKRPDPELQLRKLDTLRGCRFGGLGLRWVVLSNALTATANPSPPSLQPRQTHHRSHASQVLSYSFKSAAPYAQEPKAPKTRTPAQQNHYPPNLQGFKFGGLGFVGAIRTHKVTSYPNPSPPHVQPPPAADFSELCLISPPRSRLPEHPAGHLGGNNA